MADANYVPFPKMLYHAAGTTCTVQSQAEMDALGSDWHDTPDQSTWPAHAPVHEEELPYTPPSGLSFTMPSPPPQSYGHSALPEGDENEPSRPRGNRK